MRVVGPRPRRANDCDIRPRSLVVVDAIDVEVAVVDGGAAAGLAVGSSVEASLQPLNRAAKVTVVSAIPTPDTRR